MKIIFICGSLEPGKDGVGDYTRRLSSQLIINGNEAHIIAVNEAGSDFQNSQWQELDNIKVPVLRLSSQLSWAERMEKAREYIKTINPDWLSLQYVPFSFHVKGIPLFLAKELIKLNIGNAKWQITLHEIWVEDYDAKSLILAFLQKRALKSIYKALKPAVVHTTLPEYSIRLQRIGIKTKELPLFSNIAYNPEVKPGVLKKEKSDFVIAFFSQVMFREAIVIYLQQLVQDLKNNGLDPVVVFIGGTQKSISEMYDGVKTIEGISKIMHTGFLDEETLSATLTQCDLGITPVPLHVVGKSGSVAAFLSHGIPVAVPYIKKIYAKSGAGYFDKELIRSIVSQPTLQNIKEAAKAVPESSSIISLQQVTNKMIKDLI